MNCVLCKQGTLQPGHVTVTLERGGSIVLIKDVPAQVCDTCGNYVLSAETTRLVLERGNEAVRNGAELEVVRLKAA